MMGSKLLATLTMPWAADGRPTPGVPPVVQDMSLDLAPGSRCLLIGANGAGEEFRQGSKAHF